MRRVLLLALLASLLVLVFAVGAHADYWPPDQVRQLLGGVPHV